MVGKGGANHADPTLYQYLLGLHHRGREAREPGRPRARVDLLWAKHLEDVAWACPQCTKTSPETRTVTPVSLSA